MKKRCVGGREKGQRKRCEIVNEEGNRRGQRKRKWDGAILEEENEDENEEIYWRRAGKEMEGVVEKRWRREEGRRR